MRRLIRNSPFLYPLYVKCILRNESAQFPEKDTALHLTGFQRSANTYCNKILTLAFPSLSLSTHIHTAASIKLAFRFKVPTMVLLRDPVSTCCSSLLRRRAEPSAKAIESLLLDYIEYHEYVFENRAQLEILRFEDVVSSPEYIIRVVCQRLNIDLSDADIAAKALAGQRLVEAKESDKAVEGSSLPNETRKQMKAGIESHVRDHPLCEPGLEVHARLLDHFEELNRE
jgi:hypothetical protein